MIKKRSIFFYSKTSNEKKNCDGSPKKKKKHIKLAASFGKCTTTLSPLCESQLNMIIREHDTQFWSYCCSIAEQKKNVWCVFKLATSAFNRDSNSDRCIIFFCFWLNILFHKVVNVYIYICTYISIYSCFFRSHSFYSTRGINMMSEFSVLFETLQWKEAMNKEKQQWRKDKLVKVLLCLHACNIYWNWNLTVSIHNSQLKPMFM